MTVATKLRRVLKSPPTETVELIRDRLRHARIASADRREAHTHGSYSWTPDARMSLQPILQHSFSMRSAPSDATQAAIDLWCRGWFDVLGSGWMPAHHGVGCRGYAGHTYPPSGFALSPEDVIRELNEANREVAHHIWALAEGEHTPIDWQRDLRSGFRWSANSWHTDITYGDDPGADVKVPWELGRLQHLPQLAIVASSPTTAPTDEQELARVARCHLVDFLASNPPGFGVSWACAMDVSIRLANIVVANELFQQSGHWLDPALHQVVAASVWDHCAFVVRNLEWHRTFRSNHYLADIVGLLVGAAALPSGPVTDGWLALAVQETCTEGLLQLDRDGAGVEGSTGYHRLSAEMLTIAAATLCGFPAAQWSRVQRGQLAERAAVELHSTRPTEVPQELLSRLCGAARFTRACTAPDGSVVQIGDNDSGRFLKLSPSWHLRRTDEVVATYSNLAGYDRLDLVDPYPWEALNEHSSLLDMVASLTQPTHVPELADGHLIRALAGSPVATPPEPHSVTVQIGARAFPHRPAPPISVVPGGPPLDTDLTTTVFPSFGVVVMRSTRVYLTFRCGPVGQNGHGGHAHNDQLSIELWIDGIPWCRDPGSPVYTADPTTRNRYRSAFVHFGPGVESGDLSDGLFRLSTPDGGGTFVWVGNGAALGQVGGTGRLVKRLVAVEREAIRVTDTGGAVGADPRSWTEPPVPVTEYSDGYGWWRRLP